MDEIFLKELKEILCPISDEILAIFITFIESYSGGINVKDLRKALPIFCPTSLEKKYLDYLVVFYVFQLHEVPKDLDGISFDEIARLLLEDPKRKALNKFDQRVFSQIYYIVIFLRIRNKNLGEMVNISRALITFVSRGLCTSQTGGKVTGLIAWVMDIFRLIFDKPKSTRVIHNSSEKKRSRELDDAVTGLLSISEEKKDSPIEKPIPIVMVLEKKDPPIKKKTPPIEMVLEDGEEPSSIKLW